MVEGLKGLALFRVEHGWAVVSLILVFGV